MAEGKNSIIVYRDWKNIFNELTDDEAGKLIKHFFSYVNDENPVLEDKYLRMAFLPIKDTLKRDLKHWESVKHKRSESGRIGGLKSGESRNSSKQNEANEANALILKQNEANEAVIDNVIDNVIDSVIVNDNGNEKKENNTPLNFNFVKSLSNLGIEKIIIEDWLKVRKGKKASNTETAFKAINREIEKSGKSANECITIAVERSWSGFKAEWIDKDFEKKKNNDTETTYYKPIKFDTRQ